MRNTGVEFTFSQLYPKQPLSIDDSNSILMIRKGCDLRSLFLEPTHSLFPLLSPAFVRVIGIEAEPPNYVKSQFTLYPLALFEIIHQHVYKAASFNDFRRRSSVIETTIQRQSVMMRSTLNDSNFNTMTSQLRENELTLRKEKQKWQASSWVFTLLEWHRTTAWRNIYQKS